MQKDEKKEVRKEEKAAVTLKDYLLGQGYKLDRNYLSWGMGKMAHVSWKVHFGYGDTTQRLASSGGQSGADGLEGFPSAAKRRFLNITNFNK